MSLNHRTVTVIGAGLAGLAAAYDLNRASRRNLTRNGFAWL